MSFYIHYFVYIHLLVINVNILYTYLESRTFFFLVYTVNHTLIHLTIQCIENPIFDM